MVEQLFISQLLTIAYRTEMFHLDTPTLLDDLVGLGLKLDHRWRVSGNVIGSPHFGVNDTVQRPTKLFNGEQTRQTVFTIAEGKNILGHRLFLP